MSFARISSCVRSGTILALLMAPPGSAPSRSAEMESFPLVPPTSLFWDGTLTLRMVGGYKDNPQLSSLNPTGSGFLAGGGDLLIFRVPVDGFEASFFAWVEHVGYLARGVESETTAAIDARFKRIWDDGWSAGLGSEFFYLKQVFDASELVGVPVVLPAEGETVALRPMVGRELGHGFRLELEGEGSRQWLEEPLDSFWDVGGRLTLLHPLGPRGEGVVGYRFRDRRFDDRSSRDAQGVALPQKLEYQQHEADLSWRQAWDVRRRLRTVLRGGFLHSRDNGDGFFDYDRLQFTGQVRYEFDRLEFRAEAKARWYLYPVQRIGGDDGPRRERMDVTLLLRGDWKVHPKIRVYVQYDLERSDDNVPAGDYTANTLSAGVEMEL